MTVLDHQAIIAVDARKYGPLDSGIGRYTASLLGELLAMTGDETFLSLRDPADTPAGEMPRSSRLRWVAVDAPYHSLRSFWRLPQVLREQRADLFHSHNYHAPPFLPCPLVLTVHDLTPLNHPPSRAASFGKPLLGLLFKMAVAQAQRIIVPSQWTSRDLRSRLKVPAERIRVIPEGVDDRFGRRPDNNQIARVRHTYNLPERFLLYVGRWRPHKNIPTMVRAFNRIASQPTGTGLHLVVAGSRDPQRLDLFGGTSPDVTGLLRFTGFVSDEDLPAVYSLATALVVPSFAEGFGLTALEGMACGTPVIAANAGALPEVCGDAAMLVDPWSETAMAQAMGRVLSDQALRVQLAGKGQDQARRFTWQETSGLTMQVYREVLAPGACSGGI
jgi:glycosyltransferase involved in cell wall biosynthesis